MKRLKDFFLLDFIDFKSIPSLSQGLFLLPLPVLNFFFGEGVCQALKAALVSDKPSKAFFNFFDNVRARIEIVIKSQRYNRGNHTPMPTSFFQLESLMWSS